WAAWAQLGRTPSAPPSLARRLRAFARNGRRHAAQALAGRYATVFSGQSTTVSAKVWGRVRLRVPVRSREAQDPWPARAARLQFILAAPCPSGARKARAASCAAGQGSEHRRAPLRQQGQAPASAAEPGRTPLPAPDRAGLLGGFRHRGWRDARWSN